MKTQTNHKLLYALGKLLGQPLAWVLRKQKRVANWLIAKGLSPKLTQLLLIALNLFIFVTILFAVLPHWMVIIIAIVTALTCFGVDIDIHNPSENRYEYRGGTDGFGTYDNQFGYRVDAGSIEDEE